MRVAVGQNLLEAAHANDVDLEGAQAAASTHGSPTYLALPYLWRG